ncbi:hypothetical protein ASPZODRAFT_944827 [Penicilliopsis zonata CBS 506.65]|uniref:SET domain-containing protein n=1 Tax=Penicilliopsis zonata CBS 506.65 TaxID=1073090 RepID=A0A1L9S8E3_9EURO|nr:hypothetical protein ASPZODRAFT_944827 [Penicilliopsis zonata CBS 506.65]OJJ43428.1 hypothetical protein ASPZODRAFT_944827 [Penicilliopsis zonata CBS 506.65]
MAQEQPNWWPGEAHEKFTKWAISQGVEASGVSPARFHGRGLGMIATRGIEKGELILSVPLQVMLTTDSIPLSFATRFADDISVHGLLAAFLTHGEPKDLEKYDLWRLSWPMHQEFKDSMPILWPQSLRTSNTKNNDISSPTICLPPSISGLWNSFQNGAQFQYEYDRDHQDLLPKQEKRLLDAWDRVLAVFPDTDWDTYSYYWLIVNTRSFYYLMPGIQPPEDRNDAMALVPFADYFNHSDVAVSEPVSCHLWKECFWSFRISFDILRYIKCDVNFDGTRYTFRATKSYDKGEEIYMSYGPHSNDFLFTEYGFFLDENDYESLYLDDIVFRDLNASQKEELNLQQYYGNYQLTASGACYRTEIAACIKYMTRRNWRNYVLGHSTKGVDARKTESVIRGWVKTYSNEAKTTITALEALRSNEENVPFSSNIDMLLKRWKQIEWLCNNTAEAIS